MARCDTKSYWVAGVKVASGQATALTADGPRRVVCTTAGEGEIHVRDLLTGTAIDVDGLGVLVFDQATSRGRAGLRTDLAATCDALPRKIGDRFVRRIAAARSDTNAVLFVLERTDDPRLIRPLLARSPQSWKAVVTAAITNDDDPLTWALQTNVDVITDAALLGAIARSDRTALAEQATTTLARLGHSDVLCDQIKATAAAGALTTAEISKMIAALIERKALTGDHNVLQALLDHGDLTLVLHKLAWPRPHYVGPIHAGDNGELIARTLLKLPYERFDTVTLEKATVIAWKLVDGGAPSGAVLLAHLGATNARPVHTPSPSFVSPRFVDSNDRDAERRREHDMWEQAVASVAETGEFPESLGRHDWMQLGWAKGLPKELWSQATFSERVRGMIVAHLDDDELRSVLPLSRGKTKAAVLRRLDDATLWNEAVTGQQRRPCLEAMPLHLLDQAYAADPGDVLIREVVVERGVLPPQTGLADLDARVRAVAATKTRNQNLIAQAMNDEAVSVIRTAMRRCTDSQVLSATAARLEARDESKLAKLVSDRLAQVRWWEVAKQALERGEIVVARAALAEMLHDDLIRDLASEAALMPWAAQRLVAAQHVHSIRTDRRLIERF